jgi:type II secretory pathway component HofQ
VATSALLQRNLNAISEIWVRFRACDDRRSELRESARKRLIVGRRIGRLVRALVVQFRSKSVVNLELTALEAEGKGKIVSSPRVITADQVEALIEQGTELPYQAATSSGATQVQFRKANLALKVTPQITPEGNVILDVDVNKDGVGRNTAAGFAIDTKHVRPRCSSRTVALVIGGIFAARAR